MRATRRRLIPTSYQGGAVAPRARRRGRRRLLALLFVLIAGGGVLALGLETARLLADSQWLRVRHVRVEGAWRLTVREILDWLGPLEGRPLIGVDAGTLATRLRSHPRILDAQIGRRLDGGVAVKVVERRPVGLLQAGVLVEIDGTGVVLPPIDGAPLPDLPVLVTALASPPVPGQRLESAAVDQALQFLAGLARDDPALLERVAEVDLGGLPVLTIRLLGGEVTLRTRLESLTAEKLSGLHAVLAEIDEQGRRAVEIDLRFEGQLVVRPAPDTEG